jgi:hypothetical protein
MEDGTVLVIVATWVTAMLIFVGFECWAFIRGRRRRKENT